MSRRESWEMLPPDYVRALGEQALRWGEVEAETVDAEQALADLQSLVGRLNRRRLARVTAALALGRTTSASVEETDTESVKVLDTCLSELFGDRPDGAS